MQTTLFKSTIELPELNHKCDVHRNTSSSNHYREVVNSTLNTSTEAGSATVSEEEVESTINKTSTSTTAAPVTFIYNTPCEEVVQNCEELVFSAFAVNNIVSSCDWRIPNKYTMCVLALYLHLVNGEYEAICVHTCMHGDAALSIESTFQYDCM